MTVIGPGSTIGMLGGGQLGRMFALDARRLGYRMITLCPEEDCPAAPVSDELIQADYNDTEALQKLSSLVDVVTYEFENIPVAPLEAIREQVPISPSLSVLEMAQHRGREKSALHKLGFPTAPFAFVHSEQELLQSLEQFGGKGILKSIAWGYDGKGQFRLNSAPAAKEAWSSLDWEVGILEGLVTFQYELSMIGVRSHGNQFTTLGPFLNHHANQILDVTIAGENVVSKEVEKAAEEITRNVTESLDVIGVICIEMFLTHSGELLINEVAPRPHNSGHLTIDACATSQFEQHLRAICGLPLGCSQIRRPAAMANLLGDLWPSSGSPNWAKALAHPEIKLHLYGKAEPKPGRKMGHLTAVADDLQTAESLVRQAREELRIRE